tara:strand:- start:2189 stop:3043 length:855 start_codon:yes stop_codon:yes gene_type:complete
MKELNMYIPVRDETNFMIKYYQYLFNKYWGKHVQVYFLGYKKPDIKFDENVHFISLAEKRAPEPTAWSAPIIEYFETIEDEYFYFSVEDLLIIRPVDLELIEVCKEIMTPTIGRIDLWNSVQYDPARRNWIEFYKEHKGVKFVKQKQNPPPSTYRVSCSNSIWNRQWFLKTLEKNWSTGDWETKANDGRNNNDGYDVLATINRWTPTITHSLCKHWRGKTNVFGMFSHDQKVLLDMSSQEEKDKFIEISNQETAVNVAFNDPIRNNLKNPRGVQPNIFQISNLK